MRRENSGLIDLDALLKEASQPELPKSEEDSLEVSAPPPEPPPPAPVEPPAPPPHPSSSPSAEDSLRAVSPPPRERPTPVPWIIGLAAAVTVIAIGINIARSSHEVPAPVSLGASIATAIVPVPNEPPSVPGTSLSDLPAATSASASAASATPPIMARVPAHPPAASAQLVAITDPAPESSGDLGGAMREAVGPRASAEIAPVEATTGSARQLRPSPGAVVGAIGSVMPEARVCLGDSQIVRNATIVFRSDGTVARVDIAGPPNVADECIRGALTKARTMPFVEDTFAAKATVRP